MTLVQHAWLMIGRQSRILLRQPIWIALLLIQPMIWLLLYGQLFKRVVDIPGFGDVSYIEFLTPGIVIMNAFFGSMWAGMATIEDLDRNVIGRFLATPASRLSLILSQVVRSGFIAVVQALILLLVGLALGAHPRSAAAWPMVLVASIFVATAFSGLSHGLALLVRREESMIGIANFLGLPLLFVSSTLLSGNVMPHWMHVLSHANPVEWGVRAARGAMLPDTDWGDVWLYVGALVVLTVATSAFATWCFRRYQATL